MTIGEVNPGDETLDAHIEQTAVGKDSLFREAVGDNAMKQTAFFGAGQESTSLHNEVVKQRSQKDMQASNAGILTTPTKVRKHRSGTSNTPRQSQQVPLQGVASEQVIYQHAPDHSERWLSTQSKGGQLPPLPQAMLTTARPSHVGVPQTINAFSENVQPLVMTPGRASYRSSSGVPVTPRTNFQPAKADYSSFIPNFDSSVVPNIDELVSKSTSKPKLEPLRSQHPVVVDSSRIDQMQPRANVRIGAIRTSQKQAMYSENSAPVLAQHAETASLAKHRQVMSTKPSTKTSIQTRQFRLPDALSEVTNTNNPFEESLSQFAHL